MSTGEEIAQEAKKWIGTRFLHQGRSKEGIDCVGLVVKVAENLGYSVEDEKGYNRTAQGYAFQKYFDKQAKKIKTSDIRPGDLLIFADSKYPCHVAIYVETKGIPCIVHAHALRRKVLEEPFEGEWKSKLRGAYRISDEV